MLRKNGQIKDTEMIDYDCYLSHLPEINSSLNLEHLYDVMKKSEPKIKSKKRMPKSYNSFDEMHTAKCL